jgi:ABC-type phosphate transport system permease subunit
LGDRTPDLRITSRKRAADDHHNWAGEAKAEFKTALAPAAVIVLMAITFLCNGVALFLRNRYHKRW